MLMWGKSESGGGVWLVRGEGGFVDMWEGGMGLVKGEDIEVGGEGEGVCGEEEGKDG